MTEKHDWGKMLATFRLKAGFKTLESLADALSKINESVSPSTLSRYENDTQRIPKQRERHLALIYVLAEHAGIISPNEANFWLESAGFGYLTDMEKARYFPQEVRENRRQNAPRDTDTNKPSSVLSTIPSDFILEANYIPPQSFLPFKSNPHFVGRREQLLKLVNVFKGNSGENQNIIAVTGIGGVGKTQLTIEFAHRYGQFFEGGVFWMSFANHDLIASEVAKCGGPDGLDLHPDFENLRLTEKVKLVQRAWKEPIPRLLIFDECEDESLLIEWSPKIGGGHILVTSRRGRWTAGSGIQQLNLESLARKESIALLYRFRPDMIQEDANAIAERLGDLPLALYLAGSYLNHYVEVSPAEYANQLRTLRSEKLLTHSSLLGLSTAYKPTNRDLHVARTFTLSFQQLNSTKKTDYLARNILARAVCFSSNEPIPRKLLQETMLTLESDLLQITDALERLITLGLISEASDKSLHLHKLLSAFVNDALSDGMDDAYRTVAVTLLQVAQAAHASHDFAKLQGVHIHLRHAAENVTAIDQELAQNLWDELGHCLYYMADYANAKTAFENALQLADVIWGPNHPEVASQLSNLGLVLAELGLYKDAIRTIEKAVTIDQAAYGQHDPKVAIRLNNLGIAYKEYGDYPKAFELYSRALNIDESHYGQDHHKVAIRLNNIGAVLERMGRYEEALVAHERAHHIDRAIYGFFHPIIAIRLNNIGVVMKQLGRYSEAIAACEKSVVINLINYGLYHSETATNLGNLGAALEALSEYEPAKSAYELTLTIDEAVLHSDHPTVARDLHRLASVLRETGDFVKAKAYLDRAISIAKASLSANNPAHDLYRVDLGKILQQSGYTTEAKRMVQQAAESLKIKLGPNHPLTLAAEQMLGEL